MSAVGPSQYSNSNNELLTAWSAALTPVSADTAVSTLFNNGYCRRVYCNSSGVLFIKRVNDAAFVSYQVTAGQYIDGVISVIGGTTTGTTVTGLVLEL